MSGFGQYGDWNDWNSSDTVSELSSDLGFDEGAEFKAPETPESAPQGTTEFSGLFNRKNKTEADAEEKKGFFSRLFSGGNSSSSSSAVVAPMGYRDIEGTGGYTYRQWENGDIAILAGSLPAGWSYDTPGPRDAAYTAIRSEIGSYPASSTTTGASATSSASKKKGLNKKQKAQLADAGKTLVSTALDAYRSATSTPDVSAPSSSSQTNWPLIIGGGITGIVVIGGVWYLVSRKKATAG